MNVVYANVKDSGIWQNIWQLLKVWLLDDNKLQPDWNKTCQVIDKSGLLVHIQQSRNTAVSVKTSQSDQGQVMTAIPVPALSV